MTKKTHPVITWVHPDFKRKLKVEAADNNMTIIKYSEFLASKGDNLKPDVEGLKRFEKRKFRGDWDFGF